MPKFRPRTTDRGSWSVEELESAMRLIEKGVSIRKVSKKMKIPYTTLQRNFKKYESGEILEPAIMGRQAIFNKEQEDTLVRCINKLNRIFYDLTRVQLRKIAYRFAERLKIPHPFNNSMKMAGRDWMDGFIKRNPRVTIPKPQPKTGLRKVHSFRSNLEKAMTENDYKPANIYNVDEMSVQFLQENITVICAMNVIGAFVPPIFIFPRKVRLPQKYSDDFILEYTPNGSTNERIFLKWLVHFQKYAEPSLKNPVLLILDNHSSHVSWDSYEFCRENHITMLCISPYTPKSQPIQTDLLAKFKDVCEIKLKGLKNPWRVAESIKKAYDELVSKHVTVSGFCEAGIYPLMKSEKEEIDSDTESLSNMNFSDLDNFDDDQYLIVVVK